MRMVGKCNRRISSRTTRNNPQTVKKVEKTCDEEYNHVDTQAHEIPQSEEQGHQIISSLNSIEQRLQTAENVWNLFVHKLLEIRTDLESEIPKHTNRSIIYKVNNEPVEDDLSQKLNSTPSSCEYTNNAEAGELNLPATSIDNFKKLNQYCSPTNPQFELKLQKYFLTLESDKLMIRKWIETNLSKLLHDSVASHYSWNGNKLSPTIKEPVCKMKPIKILIECAKLKYKLANKIDIEQYIRWWFARTSLRIATADRNK